MAGENVFILTMLLMSLVGMSGLVAERNKSEWEKRRVRVLNEKRCTNKNFRGYL